MLPGASPQAGGESRACGAQHMPADKRASSAAKSIAPQIAHLVEDKILQPPSAIAQKSPRPGIDEVSEQNAVARFYLRSNQTDRMPGVIGNSKGISGIGRE